MTFQRGLGDRPTIVARMFVRFLSTRTAMAFGQW
jgi:hypothetical protein